MAITGADLFFVESERMTDNTSTSPTLGGGGDMGTAIVQDAVENNVFPDVMPGDRVAGLTQMRKVYVTVLSADNNSLANAQCGFLVRPTDANVETCAFPSEQLGTAVDLYPVAGNASAVLYVEQGAKSAGVGATEIIGNVIGDVPVSAGHQVGDFVDIELGPGFAPAGVYRRITAISTSGSFSDITVDGAAMPYAATCSVSSHLLRTAGHQSLSGLALTTVAASAAATTLTLDRIDVRVCPALLASTRFVARTYGSVFPGKQQLFFPGDIVLVQHPTVPATREFATVSRVNYLTNVMTFTAGLTNAYPVGTGVTRPVPLRAIQANVSIAPFSLQAWNRTWSDTASGGAISARYLGSPTLTNEGAVNDRWVCVFTTTTQFTLTSERLGQIASGNIGTNFSPLNPTTNEPYFTLLASSWGDGWIPGNAIRFNTRAAAAPVWISRCVSPGAAGGTDFATMFIRGDVNA